MLLSCLLKKLKRKGRRNGQETQSQIQRRLRQQNPKGRVLHENKRSQGPGAQNKSEEEVNMQEVVYNLRKQIVVAGRVFDMGLINLPGMESLQDMVEI